MPKYSSYINTNLIQNSDKSEYQPWLWEFIRLNDLVTAADELAIAVRCGQTENIKTYYVVLYQIYMTLKPYVSSYKLKEHFKRYNFEIQQMLENWDSELEGGVTDFPNELVVKMTYYHEFLLFVKNILGLSLPMVKHIKFGDKMKNALLGKG
jgi:hypothetical protein